MGSDSMIYIPGFIKIGASVQKLIGRGYTYRHKDTLTKTHTQTGK
jgi:hypothetical protein